MIINPTNFLYSLARYMADVAELAMAGVGTSPWAVWVNQAVTTHVDDTYSVLEMYGGSPRTFPHEIRSVQVKTTGRDLTAAIGQGQSLYEATLMEDRMPLRMTQIAGYTPAGVADGQWLVNAIHLNQPPTPLSVSDDGWHEVVWNMDVEFQRS